MNGEGGFNTGLALLFAAILLAVIAQNWWLRRRAEGESLLPASWKRRLESWRR